MYAAVLAFFILLAVTSIYVLHSKTYYSYVVKIYSILEFGLIAWFLAEIVKSKLAKRILLLSIPTFSLFAIFSALYFSNTQSTIANYPYLLEALIFIVFIIFFFYEKMKSVVLYPLSQSITFWICVAFFLFFTGNFFFFLFLNFGGSKELNMLLGTIYGFVTISKNIILSFALFATEPVEINEEQLHIPTDINLDDFTLPNSTKT